MFVKYNFYNKAVNKLIMSMTQNMHMEKFKIVPDVIASAPAGNLVVKYKTGIHVEEGKELTPTQVKEPPKIEWTADENTFYTLALVDPDAPSRKEPKFREWQHWLIGNIPGNNLADGEVLSEYIGSGPPQGTGLHRYVFLLFKQPEGKIDFAPVQRLKKNSGQGRGNFSTQKFAEKYKLGQPIAGNFFQAQWDDYVPTLYQQLKG